MKSKSKCGLKSDTLPRYCQNRQSNKLDAVWLCGVWTDNNNRLTNLNLLALIVFFFSSPIYSSGRRLREREPASHQKKKSFLECKRHTLHHFRLYEKSTTARTEKKKQQNTHERCRSPSSERCETENAF